MTRKVISMIRRAIPAVALLAAASPVAARATAVPQVLEKTRDAVVKGVTVAADKTKEGLSKTGEVMTDEWITTRVHQRFVDEDLLKGSDISVDTDHHVVTLKGTVKSETQKRRAVELAEKTVGVGKVIADLDVVDTEKPEPDASN